jgi:hypothetical protein
MKKLLITFSIFIALFGSVETIRAEQPFVRISTTPGKLDLGTITFWSDGVSASTLTVNVVSNCIHGPIVASISPLKRNVNDMITPDRILVKTPATRGFVSMERPVSISETEEGSHDITMNFKIDTTIKDRAGRYSGSLAFTIMPPS